MLLNILFYYKFKQYLWNLLFNRKDEVTRLGLIFTSKGALVLKFDYDSALFIANKKQFYRITCVKDGKWEINSLGVSLRESCAESHDEIFIGYLIKREITRRARFMHCSVALWNKLKHEIFLIGMRLPFALSEKYYRKRKSIFDVKLKCSHCLLTNWKNLICFAEIYLKIFNVPTTHTRNIINKSRHTECCIRVFFLSLLIYFKVEYHTVKHQRSKFKPIP